MQRRVMTEKEKKAYERKVRGIISPKEILHSRKTKYILIAVAVVILLLLGVFVFFRVKPLTISTLIGSNYETVEFSDNQYEVSIEDLKSYTLKEAFPGSFGDAEKYDCTFYNEEGQAVGSVTFIADQPYFLYNNQVYSYSQDSK